MYNLALKNQTFFSMILLADSGSTKTHWKLLKPNNTLESHYTKGLNPYFAGEETFLTVLGDGFPINKNEIRHLYFYGSGCAAENKALFVTDFLKQHFTTAQIFVYSDLFGACRALLGNNPGIVCILGTGSVSCVFDGNNIVDNVPSLGYILGDEAGGVSLGRELLRAYFYKNFPPELHDAFHETFQITRDELLLNIYHSPSPNAYLATFSSFLKTNYTHPFLHEMISNCFRNFFTNHIIKYPDYQKLPLVFTGSVSSNLQDILTEVAAEYNLTIQKIMKEPMPGLVEYHQQNLI